MINELITKLENDGRVERVGKVRTEERESGYYECFTVTFTDYEKNRVEQDEDHLDYLLDAVLQRNGLKIQHPVRPSQNDFLGDPTIHVEKKSDQDYSTP